MCIKSKRQRFEQIQIGVEQSKTLCLFDIIDALTYGSRSLFVIVYFDFHIYLYFIFLAEIDYIYINDRNDDCPRFYHVCLFYVRINYILGQAFLSTNTIFFSIEVLNDFINMMLYNIIIILMELIIYNNNINIFSMDS